MDPANRIETSAMTLSRVEQNDPALRGFQVSNIARGTGNYWPNDSADLARLGVAIGANTSLRNFAISSAHELADMVANNGAFFEGLKRNTSINDLWLECCDFSGGMGRDILSGYVANNSNLTGIVLSRCALGNRGGGGVLASAVTSCTNVDSIMLFSCNIDDGFIADFVPGIRGLHQLRLLDLSWNNFGRAGCEALATLLQDPNGNLRHLGLSGNNRTDDNCANILAESLKGNRKLESLRLSSNGNGAITDNGWDAFSQVLCDTSSINGTFLSNHTLWDLGNADPPANFSALLELNSGVDRKEVAVQKILRHHTHLDMEPFLEWDLKVLPLAVSWFDRARAQIDEPTIDARNLSAIYQFARALPMRFLPPPNKATNKRKIGEVN